MGWLRDALDVAKDAGQVLLFLAAILGATKWGRKLRLDAVAREWERVRAAVDAAVRATEQLHAKDAGGGPARSIRKRDEAVARARVLLPKGVRVDDEELADLVEAAVHDLSLGSEPR